jgi:NAD(P)-dependent dehydrogenase (short-subunit alcohol dehydrogenase family)
MVDPWLRRSAHPQSLIISRISTHHPSCSSCNWANTQQVASVFEQAIEVFGRVDVVFNNAGIGICAELEAAPDHRNREVMEVNFWGALAVSQCAVQCFRDKNPPGLGGRLIQSSSYSDIQSTPGFGIYCASKAGKL